MSGRGAAGWLVFALAGAAVPLAVHNQYYLQVIVTGYIFAIAVYGLNIILGYAGQLSLGHAAFFGLGAYTVGLLTTRAGVSFWIAIVAACVVSVALGYAVGAISLRTRGHYFAIFTAAIGVMINIVFTNWQALTNGNIGIVNIPPPAPLGVLAFDGPVAKYYLVFAALVLTMVACRNIVESLVGRTFRAIADNEELAAAVGIDVLRNKRLAFMLATLFAGLAGGLFAVFIGFLGPNSSGLDITFDMLLYLIVGGLGTLAGPLAGSLALVSLTQSLAMFEKYQMLIFGPALVLLIMFFPGGLCGGFARLRAALRRYRRAA